MQTMEPFLIIWREFREEETCPTMIVCADWNICHKDQKGHSIYKFMMNSGFRPCQNPPRATQREGRCIDMIWMKSIVYGESYRHETKPVYYSDHCLQSLSLFHLEDSIDIIDDIIDEISE